MKTGVRGFTLLELLTVVSISLLLLALLAPLFQVTTTTVRRIESKLNAYERLRNFLDKVEAEIRQAALNERGEHFVVKSFVYEDTDPATPAGKNLKFFQSRRDAHSLQFPRLVAGGFDDNIVDPLAGEGSTRLTASMCFPMNYSETDEMIPEVFRQTIRTTLTYPNITEAKPLEAPQSAQLANVERITAKMIYTARAHTGIQWTSSFSNVSKSGIMFGDEQYRFMTPGSETRQEMNRNAGEPRVFNTYQYGGRPLERYGSALSVLDLHFAVWDDVARQYRSVPDRHAVYFSPAPKAIRVTVAVQDPGKRTTVVMSREVLIPFGFGSGQFSTSVVSGPMPADGWPVNRLVPLDATDPRDGQAN